METIALGFGSVLASGLFAWMLWLVAEHEVRRVFAGLAKTPYRYDRQRSFTPLESYASRLLARRHGEPNRRAAEPGLIFVKPTWVWMSGALVDLTFWIGATLILVGSTRVSNGLWRFLLLWYIATGTWLFISDVLGRGEIGRLGYHLRFLLSSAVWPLLLAKRTAGWRQIAGRLGCWADSHE